MKSFFALFTLLFASTITFSQEITYHLSMPHPETHYFNVEMDLSNFNADTLRVKMPVWAPGSYLVREFSANVNLVTALDENNKTLKIRKSTKNTWDIPTNGAKKIVVHYDVYAFELSVRTSFIDLTHAYLNGTSVFMYVDGFKNLSGKVEVTPYKDFKKISTALPEALEGLTSDGSTYFQFNDYDHLVDCPMEIGNQEEFDFNAAGVHHRVAIYGQGNYDVAKLKVNMAKIVEEETKVFGVNPNKEYLFIIHNVTSGGGGLEHKNSTTLSVNRDTYDAEHYNGFLDVMAHEYFHLWNVKRLRPFPLGPFDYDRENYTSSLWLSEGFTSYFADLFLLRTGFYDREKFVKTITSGMNYIENSIGNKVQPVADASFDAWIKSYRPNENSKNTTVSYYSKGRLIGALFDAMIIDKFKGEKSLDDFMKMLFQKYAVELNRGFKDEELTTEFSAFLGQDMSSFFDDYIYGTKTLEYNEYLSAIGLNIEDKGKTTTYFGASTQAVTGGILVNSIDAGSPAEAAGLSPNDGIVSIDDKPMDEEAWKKFMKDTKTGTSFEIACVRDGILIKLTAKMGEIKRHAYQAEFVKSKDKQALLDIWLKSSITR